MKDADTQEIISLLKDIRDFTRMLATKPTSFAPSCVKVICVGDSVDPNGGGGGSVTSGVCSYCNRPYSQCSGHVIS